MTKIKNTKKGMAKKTLSMSLVVAMLATSNVPVWAAEFSDGSEAVVATEAPAADAVEEFSDNTDTASTTAEAPAVEDTENVEIATAASDYDFSGITVDEKAVNPTWLLKTKKKDSTTPADIFGTSKIQKNGADYTGNDLNYVWAYDGSWEKTGANGVKALSLSSGFAGGIVLPDFATLKSHVNETLSLYILEGNNTTPVATRSLGTIQPVNINDVGAQFDNNFKDSVTYNGAQNKQAVTLTGTINATNFTTDAADLVNGTKYSWSYDGTKGLVNAGSTVTVTGKYTGTNANCYTGELTGSYKIAKLDLEHTTDSSTHKNPNIVIKATTPGKKFSYAGGELEVNKSEVNVYLVDSEKTGIASSISLNDFVKKVTVDANAIGKNKTFTVTFDPAAINASSNFKDGNKAEFTVVSENTYDGNDNSAEIEALDLSKVKATLKNPKKVGVSLAANTDAGKQLTVSDLTFTIDNKVVDLSSLVNVSLKGSTYNTPGTYTGAILITAKDNVTDVVNSTSADLIVKTNVFGAQAGFRGTHASDYLATTPQAAVAINDTYALDYNNGKPVEFKSTDVLVDDTKALLGWFDPTGSNDQKVTDQSNYRVKYSNNIDATMLDGSLATDKNIAKLTVYAIGGDYEGCSKDFYFRIKPSDVTLANDNTATVTTSATEDVPGVAYNSSITDAEEYAEAIGLKVTGNNGQTAADKKITSTASSKDYEVEYSFVKSSDKTSKGENKENDFVKATITLNKNGNFKVKGAAQTDTQLGSKNTGVTYSTTAALAGTNNGVITLYIPIIKASINSLDVSLDQSSYTFTGTTITPKVSVKLNGKAFEEGKDYTVKVNNGINAGTAEVVVTMLAGSGYQGTKKLSATITPAKLSDVKFAIKEDKKQVYDGTQKKPKIFQIDDPTTDKKDEHVDDADADANVLLGTVSVAQFFDISYGKNVEAGKDAGTVTLKPKTTAAQNFDGSSLEATFDIERCVLTNNSTTPKTNWAIKLVNDNGLIIARDEVMSSTGASLNPPVYTLDATDTDMEWTGNDTVFANSALVSKNVVTKTSVPTLRTNDYSYKIAYANNVEQTTASAPAYICVVGTGNYGGEFSIVKEAKTGNVTVMETANVKQENKTNPGKYETLLDNVLENSWASFQIKGRTFAAKNVTITNATYAGGVAVKPGSVVKDSKTGTVLTEGKDYELVFDKKNVDATATSIEVSVKGIGQYKGSLVNAKADGTKLTFAIDKKDLKDCSVSVDKNLKLTVMNGNVLETKENFTVKDNGDGTATVSVVDGGKNYTGSVNVEIGGRKVGAPMISNVKVVGNKATVILSDDVEGASGYDYVISTDKDCITNKDYAAVNKNQAKTTTTFKYVDKGTYYAYCHAWTRDANGKKVFGEWSNGFQFSVTATTPDAPVITDVKVSGSTIKVTYRPAANATGYDVVLGTSSKKDNGELRPYNYGAHKKLNLKEGTVTATFKNVPKGTWTVGMHAFNRTSIDNKKVFSPWSNLETAKVK